MHNNDEYHDNKKINFSMDLHEKSSGEINKDVLFSDSKLPTDADADSTFSTNNYIISSLPADVKTDLNLPELNLPANNGIELNKVTNEVELSIEESIFQMLRILLPKFYY